MAFSENYKYKNPDVTGLVDNVKRMMGIDSGAAGRRSRNMSDFLTGAKTEGQLNKNVKSAALAELIKRFQADPTLSDKEKYSMFSGTGSGDIELGFNRREKRPFEVQQEQEKADALKLQNNVRRTLMDLSQGKPQLAPDGSMKSKPKLDENDLRQLILALKGSAEGLSKNNILSGDFLKQTMADELAQKGRLEELKINKADTTARYKINEDVKVDLKKIAGEKAVKLDKNLKELEAKKVEIKAEYGKGGSAERIATLKARYNASAKVVIGEIDALQKTIQEKDKNRTNLEAAKHLNVIKGEIGKDLNRIKGEVGKDLNIRKENIGLDKNLKGKEVALDKNLKGKEAALDKNQQALTASKYKTDKGKPGKYKDSPEYLLGDKFRKAREIVIQEEEDNWFSEDKPRETVTVEPYDFQQLAKIREAGGGMKGMRKYLSRNFNRIEQAHILADFYGFSETKKEELIKKIKALDEERN